MLVAICDDEKAECEKVTGILTQKMRKRREPLQIVCFQQGEDLIEPYEDGRKPGYDLIFMDIFLQKEKTLGSSPTKSLLFIPSQSGFLYPFSHPQV